MHYKSILGGKEMKNIHEILKSLGIEIPADKKTDFEKELVENYKTVSEMEVVRNKLTSTEKERDDIKGKYDTNIKQRDTDLESLQTQLKDAGVDKKKLEELQTSVSDWQTKYDTAKQEYETQMAKQKYEYAVKENVENLKFSSNSAKKAFLSELLSKELKVENDKILGFTDFVNAYKETDAEAFAQDTNEPDVNTPPASKPKFADKSNPAKDPKTDEGKKERPIIW